MISACLITRNESDYIRPTIESIRSIVDEVVVADTGSTDSTCEIARGLGAVVQSIPWTNNFSAARNRAIQLCRYPWILMMDADETIAQQDLGTICSTLDTAPKSVGGFMVTLRVYTNQTTAWNFMARPLRDSYHESAGYLGWIGGLTCKLFRNTGEFRYRNIVHESIVESIAESGRSILNLNVVVHNIGLQKGRDRKSQYRYQSMLSDQIATGNYTASTLVYAAQLAISLDRDLEKAGQLLSEALRLDPTSVSAKLLLATVAFKQGDYQMAFSCVEPPLITPLPHHLARVRIVSAIACGQLAVAEAGIAEILAKNPNDIDILYQKAHSEAIRSNWSECEAVLNAILQINPNYEPAKRRLHELVEQGILS